MADLITPGTGHSDTEPIGSEREWARRQVERKRKLRADVLAYAVVNVFLVGAWAVTGFGYFWPAWVMAGWGVLLVLGAWNVYGNRKITESDIERELRRMR
jgi:fatty acid desaturase